MSERTLRRVLLAAALLGAAYLAITWAGGSGGETEGDDPVSAVLAGVADSTVQAVRIRRPDLTLDLTRSEGRWRANEFEADSSAVAHLFQTVREARVTELVSRNPENHPSLGVTQDSAWTVRFVTRSDSTPRILVGERGPYDPSAYVRLADDDRVYVLRGQFRPVVGGAMIQWRDKTVAEVDTSAVEEVRVRRPEGSYRIRRGADGWSVEEGAAGTAGTVDAAAVAELLGGLARMEAYAFATDPEGMDRSVREVVALGGRGDTLTWIRAAPSSAGGSWLVRSARGRGAVFRVASDPVERVSPPADSLRASGAGG